MGNNASLTTRILVLLIIFISCICASCEAPPTAPSITPVPSPTPPSVQQPTSTQTPSAQSPPQNPPPVQNPPVIAAFSIEPSQVNVGGDVTLFWNVGGADSVSIDQGIGNVPVSGQKRLKVQTTTPYTLTATNGGGTVTKSITVTAVIVSEPLEYRELDAFTTEAIKDVRGRASVFGYNLPNKIVEWPYFALYIVVQNLDDVPGTFNVHYTLTTADKAAAERQMWLHTRTPEEYAELNREHYEGNIEFYLNPGEAGITICPPDGIYIAPDRVPFDHKHEIIPDTETKTN